MNATDKEGTPSEHFDSAISARSVDQVSALGPAGLSGAQVAFLGAHSRWFVGGCGAHLSLLNGLVLASTVRG